MAIAKVVLGGVTLMDTTGVTVTAETLANGVTALGADGELITGTATGGNYDPYGLPSGYTALKYLKSTGTQWIKTDIAPTLETAVQVTGQRTVTSGYTSLMGCTNPTICIPMNNGVYAQRYYARFGSSAEKNIDGPLPVGSALPPTITVNKTQAVFSTEGMANKTLAIGATEIGTVDPNTRISLFGRHNGSSGACEKTSGFLLRAKIWDDETLVADFVPAKRDADDVLGMYDLVSDTFYTNAGSGTFVGGEF